MARGTPTLLTSSVPYASSSANVYIGHIQLRDVLICPHEQGVVCYPQKDAIVEHDLTTSETNIVTKLGFHPNSLSCLRIPNTNETLLAVGGQEAELHLSLYGPPSHSLSPLVDAEGPDPLPPRGFGPQRWRSEVVLDHPASINNSVQLTSFSLASSHASSAEPRVVISNNDKTVKFYDIALRADHSGAESTISYRLSHSDSLPQRISLAGLLTLDVPVNHSSLSPDGRTLLSVGDSPDIYLHRINGSSRVSFAQISKLSLSNFINTPTPAYNPHNHGNPVIAASFSTAFSSNGSKFAVASQEGVVVVWDVRSTKPLKAIQTDKTRRSGDRVAGNGGASGWLFETPWDWSRGMSNAPGWGVRSVKFSPDGVGKEVMTFTEHTSLMHVVDARTFETEEIVCVPSSDTLSRPSQPRSRSSSPPMRMSSISPSQDAEPVPLPPPPRILMFSGAVEDAFRIPISESGPRRRRHARRIRGTRDEVRNANTDEEPDVDGIVVIPPLGDWEVENDVRRLLGRRTSHARTRSTPHTATFRSQDDPRDLDDERDQDDGMDVDDFEADCLSSHTTSRASSPALPNPSSSSSVRPQSALGTTSSSAPSSTVRLPMPSHIADHPLRLYRQPLQQGSWDPYSRLSSARSSSRRHRRSTPRDDEEEVVRTPAGDAEQDLAGLCFDPSGEYVYVAGTKGVWTWKVRGAEKSWWVNPTWA